MTPEPAISPVKRTAHFMMGNVRVWTNCTHCSPARQCGCGGQRAGSERVAMVVSGTALAHGAHGTASLTRTPSGWRIHLTVAGLPHIAGGRYYEGWLQDATGDRVAIGTFNDARDVTLWAGVSPEKLTTLTVTVQRSAGSPGQSGLWVLVGTRTRQGP